MRKGSGRKGLARFWIVVKRFIVAVLALWIAGLVLFSFVPVPYTTLMLEKQVSAWLKGNFSYIAHQDWVASDQISSHMKIAVIAAEDQTFPLHYGFDTKAIQQVLSESESGTMRGASTLTQQTAKNVFLWSGRSWVRKGLEAGLTLGMELLWSKKRILAVYLNVAEFGDGIFGVEMAAQRYFNKPAAKLSQSEAALLAAVLPNPIRLKAKLPSQYVLKRQQWIMRQMNQLGGKQFLEENKL